MNFNLSSIRPYVGGTIYARGQDYYKSGAVVQLEEIEEGEYEAQVEGTENYEVQISLKGDQVLNYACDCPYDDGTCKHVVAVLLAIQAELKESIAISTTGKQVKPKKKTAAEEVDEILDRLDLSQLKKYVHDQCLADKDFRSTFMLRFQRLTQTMGKAQFDKQIDTILKSAVGRYGYFEYGSASTVAGRVNKILEAASEYLACKDFAPAYFAAISILEKLPDVLEEADDSDGEIGGCVEDAIALLHEMAGIASLDEAVRKEAFDYCLSGYQKRQLSGWGWDDDLLQLAGEFARSTQEGEQIISLVEESVLSDYKVESKYEIVLGLVERFRGEDAAIEYLHAHLEVHSFRKRVIEYAIQAEDLETAMSLAEEGYELTKGIRAGNAKIWLRMQMEIAQKQKDNPKVIALARKLFLESYDEPMELYALLKGLVPKKEWHPFVEELLVSMKVQAHTDESTLGKIYVEEGWLDRLIGLVKKQNHPRIAEQFEAVLKPKYSSELVAFYEKILVRHLDFCSDRKGYATACDYLRKMKNLGGHDAVQTMVNFIRKEFAKRPAFMDELKRV